MPAAAIGRWLDHGGRRGESEPLVGALDRARDAFAGHVPPTSTTCPSWRAIMRPPAAGFSTTSSISWPLCQHAFRHTSASAARASLARGAGTPRSTARARASADIRPPRRSAPPPPRGEGPTIRPPPARPRLPRINCRIELVEAFDCRGPRLAARRSPLRPRRRVQLGEQRSTACSKAADLAARRAVNRATARSRCDASEGLRGADSGVVAQWP